MNSNEKLKELTEKLKQLHLDWDKILQNVKQNLGIYHSFSLNSIGLNDYYENYLVKIKTLESEIHQQVSIQLKEISEAFGYLGVEPLLIDYTVPFRVEVEEKHHFEKQILNVYLFFLEGIVNRSNFDEIQFHLLKEKDFFNQNDVVIKNGHPVYKDYLRIVKNKFIQLKLLKNNGRQTIIAKLCSSEIEKFIQENKKHAINRLSFFDDLLNSIIRQSLNNPNLNDLLIEIEGEKKLKANLEFIREIMHQLK